MSHTGETVDRRVDDDDAEDSDSDNEDDNDVTDGCNNKNNDNNDETKEKHDNDDNEGFFGRFFEALLDKACCVKDSSRSSRPGTQFSSRSASNDVSTIVLRSVVVYSFVSLFPRKRMTCMSALKMGSQSRKVEKQVE